MQQTQKNLLKLIKERNIDYIIDPQTLRFPYDNYSSVKGLLNLSYAPSNLSILCLEDLQTDIEKKEYVKKVIDSQLEHNPNFIFSPYHICNDSRLFMGNLENWFTMDIKLVKESINYLRIVNSNIKLIAPFCIKAEVLAKKSERDYFLNNLTSLEVDAYWIYADCIDKNTNISQLYNYAFTLLELQEKTNKPVIAGRIDSFGLILLAFGLYGFESGFGVFDSFYENLYKDSNTGYNTYASYYIPKLLNTVSIERKNPIKLEKIFNSSFGEELKC